MVDELVCIYAESPKNFTILVFEDLVYLMLPLVLRPLESIFATRIYVTAGSNSMVRLSLSADASEPLRIRATVSSPASSTLERVNIPRGGCICVRSHDQGFNQNRFSESPLTLKGNSMSSPRLYPLPGVGSYLSPQL